MRSQRHFLNSGLKRLNSIYTKMCINFRERPRREEKMERKRVRERTIGGRERERKKRKKQWGREVGQGRERVTGETGPEDLYIGIHRIESFK